jgi:hypothetical protein
MFSRRLIPAWRHFHPESDALGPNLETTVRDAVMFAHNAVN